MLKNLKQGLAIIVAGAALVGMSACGNDSASTSEKADSSQSQKEEKKTEPLDLTGTWKSTPDPESGNYWEATITDGTITINWMFDKGSSSSLYWKGSYTAPTEDVKTFEWTSNGDTDAMSKALTASQDKTKDFSYKDSKISYKASALGTTKTVELTKK